MASHDRRLRLPDGLFRRPGLAPWLVTAWVLALGLRLFVFYQYPGQEGALAMIGGDAKAYLDQAAVLATVGRIGQPLEREAVLAPLLAGERPRLSADDIWQDAMRPPGWPIALSGLLMLTGYSLVAVFWIRFLLDLVTLWLVYRLVTLLEWPRAPAALALVLMAVHPAWLIYSKTLLSEPQTLLLQIAFVTALVAATKGRRPPWVFGAVGVLGGAVLLTHPYFVLFPALLLALLFVARRLSLASAAWVVVGIAITLTPWVVRNMLLFDTTQPILTAAGPLSLAKGWNTSFLGEFRNSDPTTLDEWADVDPSLRRPDLTDPEKAEIWTAATRRFWREHWRLVPAYVGRKAASALNPFPETPRPGLLEAGRTLFHLATLIPLLWVVTRPVEPWLRTVVVAAAVAYWAMAIVTFPFIRYRFPLIWVEVLSLCWALRVGLQRFGSR